MWDGMVIKTSNIRYHHQWLGVNWHQCCQVEIRQNQEPEVLVAQFPVLAHWNEIDSDWFSKPRDPHLNAPQSGTAREPGSKSSQIPWFSRGVGNTNWHHWPLQSNAPKSCSGLIDYTCDIRMYRSNHFCIVVLWIVSDERTINYPLLPEY